MMKRILKFSAITFIIVTILFFLFDQSRSYYCIDENKCITVWKRLGGKCYIIPGKYYGLIVPSDNYILTENDNSLVFFWSNKLPHTIVFGLGNQECTVTIKNDDNSKIKIVEYNHSTMKTIFYALGNKKRGEIEPDAELIDLDIFDNCAFDKNGNEL